MLRLLLEAKVEFVIVGAYAMAVFGYPRATADIDIWIFCDSENAKKTYQVLQKFGAPLKDLTVEDLSKKGIVFQIGVAPRRIDILTQISGVDYQEIANQKVIHEIEGLKLPFLPLDALIKNKEATGRLKDKADAEQLKGLKR